MVFLLDRNMRVINVLSNDSPKATPYWQDIHSERLDDAYEKYEFLTPSDGNVSDNTVDPMYFGLRDLDKMFHVFKIVRVEDVREGGSSYKHYFGESMALEIARNIVRPAALLGVTAEQALANILTGSVWKVGKVEWSGVQDVTFSDYITSLAAIQQINQQFGGDIRFRYQFNGTQVTSKYVDLLRQRGVSNGKRFTYEKDIQGITRTFDQADLVTAVVASGQNGATITTASWSKVNGNPADKPVGQDWVGDDDALQAWSPDGTHILGVYKNDQESNPAVLLQAAWNYLQTVKNGLLTYDVNAALLERMAGYYYEHEKVRLGDTVIVKDNTFNPPVIVTARVIEFDRSYTDPTQDKVILGNFKPYVTDVVNQIAALQAQIAQGQTATAVNVTYADGSTVESLKPAAAGADVTAHNTAADTSAVNGVASATLTTQAANGDTAAATVNTNKTTWDRASNINSDGTFNTAKLNGIIDATKTAIQQGTTASWDSNGLILTDPTNTSHKVRLSSGGIAISTDGGTTWSNALTSAGLIADQIKTGTLNASNIVFTGTMNGANIALGGSLGTGLNVSDLQGSVITQVTNTGLYVMDSPGYAITFTVASTAQASLTTGQSLGQGDVEVASTLYVANPVVLEGASYWLNASFVNGWSNYGAGYANAGYYKDSSNVIHLRGLIKGGSLGLPAFYLPAGYMPANEKIYAVMSGGALARVSIFVDGKVQVETGASTAWVSLEGLSFVSGS